MVSQGCPKCGSTRIRLGYQPTPWYLKLLGRYNLLCDNCNLLFRGFAIPGTVSSKSRARRSGNTRILSDSESTSPSEKFEKDISSKPPSKSDLRSVSASTLIPSPPESTPHTRKTGSLPPLMNNIGLAVGHIRAQTGSLSLPGAKNPLSTVSRLSVSQTEEPSSLPLTDAPQAATGRLVRRRRVKRILLPRQ